MYERLLSSPPLRHLPPELAVLSELALDLRWTWSHYSDNLWKTIAPEIWERVKNPWLILHSVPQERLEQLAGSAEFKEFQERIRMRHDHLNEPGAYRLAYSGGELGTVAYFSMEFGVSEALPIYAGGLGMLAGDHLKAACDMDLPLVGIGLLYQEGYFRQIITPDGRQLEVYPNNEPSSLPIRPVLASGGEWLVIDLELPGRTLLLRIWEARIGHKMLYLLDSNHPLNNPFDRGITAKLYYTDPETRLLQEMVLGIGGWRVLKATGTQVDICHLNEGHAAFLVLERIRDFMLEHDLSFEPSLWATRAGNVFTTHTPVAAAFDSFSADLIGRYFQKYAGSLGISGERLLALGKYPGTRDGEFNMAALAMNGSTCINGVSRLHGEVSRRIFQPLYPRWPECEVPVGSITNGVHVPSWDSPWADELWTQTAGKERWRTSGNLDELMQVIQQVSDQQLWELHIRERKDLVNYVRRRLGFQFEQNGLSTQQVEEARQVLDPGVLTIGFARRFTAYKRPNLILHDTGRLVRILNHPEHPVQLIVAGKAHPEDEEGKKLVRRFVNFASQPEVRRRVVFLEDYDIGLARELVQGIDLWLNTPLRPWEASGTSGMKVLVNGGLNISELDGWWAEAYSPEVGWALGDGKEHSEPGWDAFEAGQLYDLLEKEIVPEFYDCNHHGFSSRWLNRIRLSMSTLTPRFSTKRMLQEYVEQVYLPATRRFRVRTDNGAQIALELDEWQRAVEHHWSGLSFGRVTAQNRNGVWLFDAEVYLGRLDPAFVRVEIYADPLADGPPVRQAMEQAGELPGVSGGYLFQGKTRADRPGDHFTLRIVPYHPEAVVPVEERRILWQK